MPTAQRTSIRLLVSLALFAMVSLGCSKPPGPPAAKPALAASFADGVDKAQKLVDEIKAAFDAGNPQDADGAIHTGAELLAALPRMAADEGKLDKDGLANATAACKTAFEQFGILHEGFHPHPGNEDGSHEEHSHDNSAVFDSLNKALAELKTMIAAE